MVAHDAGHRHDLFAGLEILEPRRPLERKLDLVVVEHVEHDDVDAAKLKVLQAADDLVRIVEQIRNQHDDAALGQRVGELMQRLRDVGRAAPGVNRSSVTSSAADGPGASSPAAW